MFMITPALKDQILKDLVNKAATMTYSGSFEAEASTYGIAKEVYQAIVKQFDTRGFLKLRPFVGGTFLMTINAAAHDYVLAGGHIGEIEMLELQFEKLKTELYALEKTLGHQQFERIKGIVDTVTAFWGGLMMVK